jgi:hypothetical protein
MVLKEAMRINQFIQGKINSKNNIVSTLSSSSNLHIFSSSFASILN